MANSRHVAWRRFKKTSRRDSGASGAGGRSGAKLDAIEALRRKQVGERKSKRQRRRVGGEERVPIVKVCGGLQCIIRPAIPGYGESDLARSEAQRTDKGPIEGGHHDGETVCAA